MKWINIARIRRLYMRANAFGHISHANGPLAGVPKLVTMLFFHLWKRLRARVTVTVASCDTHSSHRRTKPAVLILSFPSQLTNKVHD
jgi:hypothetical protein